MHGGLDGDKGLALVRVDASRVFARTTRRVVRTGVWVPDHEPTRLALVEGRPEAVDLPDLDLVAALHGVYEDVRDKRSGSKAAVDLNNGIVASACRVDVLDRHIRDGTRCRISRVLPLAIHKRDI